jgi:predicted nucleic acid-binding protein
MSGMKNYPNMAKISKYQSVAIDSNILIYYFQKHPHFGPIVRDIFYLFLSSQTKVITSTISLAEVLSIKGDNKLVSKLQKDFITIPFLQILPVNENIAIKAANIRRTYGYKLPDAIQLATAIAGNAQVFISNDKRLASFRKLPVILLENLNLNRN